MMKVLLYYGANRKAKKLKILKLVLAVLGAAVLAGCSDIRPAAQLLTVDFTENQILRYQFDSSRNTVIDWDPANRKSGKNRQRKSTESLKMIVAYEPVKVAPYGLTTIKALCESVKATRRPQKQRVTDAVKSIKGKTFGFTVDPAGNIQDSSELEELIRQIGKDAFRKDTNKGRIKEPDMIDDFIATQWFLWDAISSMNQTAAGIQPGQSWQSKLSIPTSMVLRQARSVTYTLKEIQQTEKGRKAVITSTYQPCELVPESWPIPYSGRFQLAGPFGFFRMMMKGLKISSLAGQGRLIFNIDTGRIEQSSQQYQMTLQTGKSAFGMKPLITVRQTITMKLLGRR